MSQKSRMQSPVFVLPEALKAMHALNAVIEKAGVPKKTLELVAMRVGQINGCSICIDMHPKLMKKAGETDERIFAIAAWRDTPYYSEAERAALALAEAVTRIADRSDPVPDDVWNEATKHYDEQGMSALLLAIASGNVWNRLNVSTRQIVGQTKWDPLKNDPTKS